MSEQPLILPSGSRAEGARSLGFLDALEQAETYERDALDLQSIWQVLWTRRYWILCAAALGLAIALAISLLQTPLYRSTAVIELNPPTIPLLPGKGEKGGELAVQTTDVEFLATQYGLLESRALAERVVQDLGLDQTQSKGGADERSAHQRKQAAVTTLSNSLEVKPVRASRLVELNYTSEDPRRAARVVNGFATAFQESNLERQFQAMASAREFLDSRLKTVRAELNESERKLVQYAKDNNIIETANAGEGNGTSADTLSGASLVALNEALAQAQQKRIAAEQRHRQSGSITEVNQSVAALRQERAKLEAEYREKAQTFKPDYPAMLSLRARIDSLGQAVSREAGGASGALRAEYQAALAEENSLKSRVGQLSANVLDQRERSIQYNILQRELDTNRSLYDALLERYNQVSVTSGIGTPNASIVDRGEVASAPASPNIPRNLALGLLLGVIIGIGMAFIHEFFTDTIKSPEDVREKLHLPPLGIIPKTKRKANLAEELADNRSAISEAYASLLTALQFTTNEGMPRSLLVTSTHPAEGKSTTSFALAQSLAQLGKTVLLLDADMRRPSFVVEERADIGLSRLLVGTVDVSEHLLPTNVANLWLMPSGPVPPNPAQLLNSDRMKKIMETLVHSFDVVIVDAPPTHGFADSPLLASVCQAVLLIIQSGRGEIKRELQQLFALQTHNFP